MILLASHIVKKKVHKIMLHWYIAQMAHKSMQYIQFLGLLLKCCTMFNIFELWKT